MSFPADGKMQMKLHLNRSWKASSRLETAGQNPSSALTCVHSVQISGIEQELVCGNNNLGSHFDTVTSLVNDSAINDSDR